MSYDIYIGEAVFSDPDKEYNDIWIVVHSIQLPNAPKFRGDDMTGQGNSRHPAYSGWSNFCDRTGLYKLFFDEHHGLMRKHPGCFRLRKTDRASIKEALDSYKAKHPNSIPGWCSCKECNSCFKSDNLPHEELDGDLARLIWLDFWVDWAMNNCDVPVISNH